MISETKMFKEAGEFPAKAIRQQERNQAAVRRIAAKLKKIDPKIIVTCARGSSDHAATYAKYLFETQMRLPVCSFAPSVESLYAASPNLRDAFFIVISQSGRSPDLLSATQAAKRGGAYVVALVNEEDNSLADIADDILPIGAGPEESVAATKSCIGAMSALYHMCTAWRDDNNMARALAVLPDVLADAWAADWSHALAPMRDIRQTLILSRGIGLAGAQEAALKLKETCMIQAEGYSAAEVRHGPMAIVDTEIPVIVAATFDASQHGINNIVQDFLGRGVRVLIAGERIERALHLPVPRAQDSKLQPLVFLQAFYKFVNALSCERGLDPDRPKHLLKVTETV